MPVEDASEISHPACSPGIVRPCASATPKEKNLDSVSIRFSDAEAKEMIVVLADLLTADHDDWHAHLRNETDTVEIVVLPEHRQVSSQADRERELNDALSELRTKGVSVMTAINMIEQWQRVDSARAKEILFSHPDWNSEGS